MRHGNYVYVGRVKIRLRTDIKDLKGKIKQWKKLRGQEKSEKIKLENKFVRLKNSLESFSPSRPKAESEKRSYNVTNES